MRADRGVRIGQLVAIALGGALSACLKPTDPTKLPVAAVRVTLGEAGRSLDTIQVLATGRVHAAAIANEGYDLGRTDFRYSSANPTVAVVDSLGTVRGVSVGTTTIMATLSNGMSGSATLVVVPSTIAYRIPVGGTPGAIAFSPDYSKAYVVVGADSVAILDALGFFRIGMIDVGQRIGAIASTGTEVYATNPDVDSVSVISPATKELTKRIWVGAGPAGIAASSDRAYVAAQYDKQITIVQNGRVTLGIPMGGEPHDVALSGDGTRLFATVYRGGSWYVVSANPAYPDTLASLALPAAPSSIAVSRDGTALYVLIPSQQKLLRLAVDNGGNMTVAASAAVPASAAAVAVRSFGAPYAVVSGNPLTVMDASTLGTPTQISGGGDGAVALRPDGLFVFVSSKGTDEVHVIGL